MLKAQKGIAQASAMAPSWMVGKPAGEAEYIIRQEVRVGGLAGVLLKFSPEIPIKGATPDHSSQRHPEPPNSSSWEIKPPVM